MMLFQSTLIQWYGLEILNIVTTNQCLTNIFKYPAGRLSRSGYKLKQAKAFAIENKYRNDYLRGEKNKTTVGEFRLPTEGEWEYAARGKQLQFTHGGAIFG